MNVWVALIAANVLAFVIEFSRLLRAAHRERNFEAIRLAAVKCVPKGWAPMRVTWHGWFRTEARMEIRHRDGSEFTLREAP